MTKAGQNGSGDQIGTAQSNGEPYAGFAGQIGRTMATSTPAWTEKTRAPQGAPNVVIVLTDDLGFSDLGCYGSEIPTPNLDSIAEAGQRYTNFHVTPLCSPTRAALLTGQNPHMAGIGMVSNIDPGFPGYTSELRDNQPTIAETLRGSGYNTLMVGKWHLCKDTDLNEAGDKSSWPLQRGFDRYYGLLEGMTNLHHPHRLYRDNSVVHVDQYPDGYYLTDDLTDQAVEMIRETKTADPSKPFFLYFAHPAPHAPLHAKQSDIDDQRGKYAKGWDVIREERFRRQRSMELLPDTTELAPRNSEEGAEVDAWDDLTDIQRTMFAGYMETYAAMVSNVDQSVGRLRSTLQDLGEWDNTIFIFLSDNGASREGFNNGTSFNMRKSRASMLDNEITPEDISNFEQGLMGGPRTWPHYPRGWAMACNTPFRLYKISTYRGGHQVPFVLSWPAGITEKNAILRQYAYVTDVVPTLLSLIGVDHPTHRHGHPTTPLAGASFADMLTNKTAPSQHTSQYFECNGNRAFYRDGWEAVTAREQRSPFGSSPDRTDLVPLSQDRWALYNVETDPSQCRDLADQQPELLEELKQAWEAAAWENEVFPINEGTGLNWLRRPPHAHAYDQPIRILPGTPTLERFRSSQLISGRPFTIRIRADRRPGDQGILVAHGGQESGYVIYIENDALHFTQNHFGQMFHTEPVPLADGNLDAEVNIDLGDTNTWQVTISVAGTERVRAQHHPRLAGFLPYEGIDIGIDRRSPVSWDLYERHGAFPYTAPIHDVTYTPGALAPSAREELIEQAVLLGASLE